MTRIRLILQSGIAVMLLTSCGNTGPLYLPKEKEVKKEKHTLLQPTQDMYLEQIKQQA